MRVGSLATILLSVTLVPMGFAGCFGSDASGPATASDLDPRPAPHAIGYRLSCPPGEATTRPSGVCVSLIGSATEGYQQPSIAIHPTRPDVLAVAANSAHAIDPSGTDGTLAQRRTLDVFFSEDAGRTWRVSTVPRAAAPSAEGFPDQYYVAADPSVVFDPNGVLHVGGLVYFNDFVAQWSGGSALPNPLALSPVGLVPVAGQEHGPVYYASTPDLGMTWTEPIVLPRDEYQNNPWIARAADGTLYISWDAWSESTGDTVRVAWSGDGGATWNVSLPPAQPDACWNASPVAEYDGEPLVACNVYDADTGVELGPRVMRFDPATGTFAPLAHVPSMADAYGPFLLAPDKESLLLGSRYPPMLSRSGDGGITWGDPWDLRLAASVDDSWPGSLVNAVSADPWGGVQALWVGDPCEAGAGVYVGDTYVGYDHCPWQVAHVAVDASTFALLGETALGPTDMPADTDPRVPPSIALAARGDQHFAIAFGHDVGVAVWTREKGLDLVLIEPVFADDDPALGGADAGAP